MFVLDVDFGPDLQRSKRFYDMLRIKYMDRVGVIRRAGIVRMVSQTLEPVIGASDRVLTAANGRSEANPYFRLILFQKFGTEWETNIPVPIVAGK